MSNGWIDRHLAATLTALAPVLLFAPSCAEGAGSGSAKNSIRQTDVGEIVVENTTSSAGVGVVDVVLPLHSGDFRTAPRLRTEFGKVCQVTPFGARWPDGTLRYVRVEAPVAVEAGGRATIKIKSASEADPAFVLHSSVGSAPGVLAAFRAGSEVEDFPEFERIENGPTTQVYRSRVRVKNTSLWAELKVLLYSGMPHGRFYLHWGNSDPRNTRLSENPGKVQFHLGRARLILEESSKALERDETGTGKNLVTTITLHNGVIGDGQSNAFEGRLVFSGDDPPRLRGIAKNWVGYRAFGPFGELVAAVQPDSAQFAELVKNDENKQPRHPWAAPHHGCNARPADSGHQHDFGTIVMREDLLLVNPSRLRSIARSVFQEACRPTHYREADVSRVTIKNHPNLVTLDGRPHWQAAEWVDMLGKPKQYLKNTANTPKGKRWYGHDGEHISVNYLAAFAMVTGDRWALEECQHHVELFKAEFTYDSGTYHDGSGAARTVGRHCLAACWLYLVTGREDLKTRILNRVSTLRTYMNKDRSKQAQSIPGVFAPRYNSSLGHYWPPWEEGICASGLMAVHVAMNSPTARDLAIDVGEAVTMHGYGKTSSGWRSGYKIPFQFSNGKPYVAQDDPDFASKQAAGNGLTTWGMSGVVIAAELSSKAAVRSRALQILKDTFKSSQIGSMDEKFSWLPVTSKLIDLTGFKLDP